MTYACQIKPHQVVVVVPKAMHKGTVLMKVSDTAKVQRYLRQRFSNHKLTLARRENKDDSADLMLEDEFIGVVFRDDEDGDTCYHVQITVLAEDLD